MPAARRTRMRVPARPDPAGQAMTASPVDPHDPGLTAAAIAHRIDELVRALNYATRPGDPRLGDVPEVYSALGTLREALAKLPQACTQLAVGLHRHESTGRLRAAEGWPHAGAPRTAVVHAAALLGEAADATAAASGALGRAQSAISGVSHAAPSDCAAPGRPLPRVDPAEPLREPTAPTIR